MNVLKYLKYLKVKLGMIVLLALVTSVILSLMFYITVYLILF